MERRWFVRELSMLGKLRLSLAPREAPNIDRAIVDAWLRVARAEIGNGEAAGSNNRGPDIERYRSATRGRTDGNGAWCAAFVSYCIAQGVAELNATRRARCEPQVMHPFLLSRSAKRLAKNCRAVGVALKHPRPGALIVWHRGPSETWRGHIGIVESYQIESGVLTTIEGNHGPKVARYEYPLRRWRHRLAMIVTL